MTNPTSRQISAYSIRFNEITLEFECRNRRLRGQTTADDHPNRVASDTELARFEQKIARIWDLCSPRERAVLENDPMSAKHQAELCAESRARSSVPTRLYFSIG